MVQSDSPARGGSSNPSNPPWIRNCIYICVCIQLCVYIDTGIVCVDLMWVNIYIYIHCGVVRILEVKFYGRLPLVLYAYVL